MSLHRHKCITIKVFDQVFTPLYSKRCQVESRATKDHNIPLDQSKNLLTVVEKSVGVLSSSTALRTSGTMSSRKFSESFSNPLDSGVHLHERKVDNLVGTVPIQKHEMQGIVKLMRSYE